LGEPIGRTLEQRTTLYGRTTTVGRRLRPTAPDATTDHHDAIPVALGAKPVSLPV